MRKKFKFDQTLRDDQWQKINAFLRKTIEKHYHQSSARLFIDAVLWVTSNNTPWMILPEKYGDAANIYTRFLRWNKREIWQSLALRFAEDQELRPMLDRIISRCDLFSTSKESRDSRQIGKQS